MKEALVELAIALVRSNLDPRTFQFYTSQPLQGHFPYQVVILTELVETMKTAPGTSPMPSLFVASPNQTPSSPVIFSPNYPPPTASRPSGRDSSPGMDNEVLKKLLTSVEKIQEALEKTLLSAGIDDSESESFNTAALSSSSRCSSLSTDYGSQSSSLSSTSSSDMSSQYRPGKPWTKSELREENICLKFQYDTCKFSRDHPGNSHLCARCHFSKHMLLEPDHSSDCCQQDLS